MEEIQEAQNSATIRVKDLHGTWTFMAKLSYIHNTEGVPPKSPTPHYPVRAILAAVEELLDNPGRELEYAVTTE